MLAVRFDYLHSAKPLLVQRMLELRAPERLHNALLALTGSIAVMAGACGIDVYRLREALRVEAVYQQRYDEGERKLKQMNLYFEEVKALRALDLRVRNIARSGDADARALAEIANVLPPHAWLTSISHDSTGVALAGRAKDLDVVGGVMRGLMHAEHLRNPALVSASLEKAHGRQTAMKYEIHVDRSAP